MRKTLDEIIRQVQIDNDIKVSEVINDGDDLINDLGFDSLNLAELTVLVEDQYGVDIFKKNIVRKVLEIKNQINE